MTETLAFPNDLDAEKAILGAILVDGERMHDVAERLAVTDFYRAAHQAIFAAMVTLNDQRQPVDMLTIAGLLGADEVQNVGGKAYIASLVDGIPRGSHIAAYVEIVKSHSVRRKVIAACGQTLRESAEEEIESAELLERAEAAIYAIAERQQRGDLRTAHQVVEETRPILEAIQDSGAPVSGVSTGFTELDRDTRGLQPGNLILLAARPAMGKTSFALNVAYASALGSDTVTAVFSLEMSRVELMTRLLTAAGQLDAHRVMSGRCHGVELQRLSVAMSEVGGAPIWIDDTSNLTVMSIRGKARRLKAKRGLGLVVIDYLQLLSSPAGKRYDNRVVEVGAMSRELKQLAKELQVPILCLAQLNRAAEARQGGRPKLSDLRESGSLEQDADVVLLLHREEEYAPTPDNAGVAEVIIAKSRNGPTGSVRLRWVKEQTRFDNWSQA